MRRTPRHSVGSLWSAIAITLSVASCSDALDTVHPLSPPESRRVAGPLPSGIIYEVGAGPTSASPDGGGRPYAPTGARLLPGTVARISASGDVTLSRDGRCDPNQPPTYSSPVTPHGLADGSGRVLVNRPGGDPGNWGGSQPGEYVMYMGADDTAVSIVAGRKGIVAYCGLPNEPVSIPEFNLSGSTILTIDILGVNVAASANTVQAGQSIHFTPASINFSRTGQITYSFDTLAYHPQIAITSCTNLLECDYVPTRSGRMEVCMYDERGYPVCGSSEEINVIKCPTGDTVLDNPVFRNALLKALKDSRADSVPSSVRREVGGYAFYDSTGLRVVRSENAVLSTPCSISYGVIGAAVLIFHVHPFNPPEGFGAAENLPAVCADSTGALRRYDVKKWGGPSEVDWQSSIDQNKPSYIIDRKRIYVTNPQVTDSDKWADSTKRYDWNTRKCKW